MAPLPDSSVNYDLNKDGIVSQEEVTKSTDLLDLELREEKASTQQRISWVAFFSILVTTAILMSPLVSDARVEALGPLLSMFYIAQASIIGAYFGLVGYMSK
jgi:hypothetical protein